MRRLRVVSWNVGRLYTPSNDNRLHDADVPRVARVLDELDGDVILLQEVVTAAQLRWIAERLDGYAGAIAERCLYDRHVAALARTRLQPQFEQRRLDPTGRGLVVVTFELGDSGRGSAHPLHFDVFDRARRRSQAESILALTATRSDDVLIFGGDLNLDPELANATGNTVDATTYSMLADGCLETGRAAGPTLMGMFRVDHLFARGPRVLRTYTRVSPGRRLPMGDHDPIILDVDLSSPSPSPSPSPSFSET